MYGGEYMKIRTTVMMDELQHKAIKEAKYRTGLDFTEILRQAVSLWLHDHMQTLSLTEYLTNGRSETGAETEESE